MKRQLDLAAPFDRGNGLSQSKVELDYIYIHDDSFTVFTKQGNSISFPMNAQRQAFVEKLEDAVKDHLEQSP